MKLFTVTFSIHINIMLGLIIGNLNVLIIIIPSVGDDSTLGVLTLVMVMT